MYRVRHKHQVYAGISLYLAIFETILRLLLWGEGVLAIWTSILPSVNENLIYQNEYTNNDNDWAMQTSRLNIWRQRILQSVFKLCGPQTANWRGSDGEL